MRTIKFYTLLYIDTENKSLSHNGLSGKNFDQQMEAWVKCCEALNKSLLSFGNYELNVLTNNKDYIENQSKELKCIEIKFGFQVPKDIGFFAAHHKIDVFRYLSDQNDLNYMFLLDSDILCINKMPLNLINCIKNNIPVYYDITDQVYPAYGRETIIKDKELLMSGNLSSGIWAGGEFIGGDSNFFKKLDEEISLIKGTYIENYKKLHHQGDESLVSVAIERILMNTYICNVGLFGGVRRYWSGQINLSKRNLRNYKDDFLLHLPSDKKFISSIHTIDVNIVKKYKNYLNKITAEIFIKNIIKKILGKKIG